MKEKNIIIAARILSMVFTPFYLPLVGLIALFTFSYLRLMPWPYKLTVLGLVYLFTILLPTLRLSRMDTHRAWQEGTSCSAISAFYRKLLCVLLCNASLQYTPLHEQHTHVGTRNTDSVRPY